MTFFQKQGLLLAVLILIFLVVFVAAVVQQSQSNRPPQIVTAQFVTANPANVTATVPASE